MANRTNLGSMLGQVLSGFNGDNQQKGYSEGIKARVGLSTIDKNNAEAQLKQQQLDNGSDDSLLSSVLSKIGANSQGGKDDLLATMAGTYKPLAGPPTQAQDRAGALAIPPPSYLGKLPQAANDFATLKQMLALGDTNYNHIGESAQQEQINKVTGNINQGNAYDVATNIQARNGGVENILKAQLANRIANDNQPKSNERALLYSQGKTEFGNMGSEGVINNTTGATSTTPVGQSVIHKNMEKNEDGDVSSNDITDNAVDMLAQRLRTDGTLPPMGMGKNSKELRVKVYNRAAALDQEEGITGAQARGLQLETKGNQAAYTQITKDITAFKPYKVMLDKNASIAIELAGKILKTDSRFINKSINWISQNATDNPDVAEFMAQNHFVSTEAARVLSNPRLVGQMPESAVKDMQEVVNGNAPLNSYVRVMQRIMKDGDNRTVAMDNEANDLKNRLSRTKPAETAKVAPTEKVMTIHDVELTAKNKGKTVQQVRDAAKAQGYTIR